MRVALVVGIDHYQHLPRLYGCVRDAASVRKLLEEHGDGTGTNFNEVHTLLGSEQDGGMTRDKLRSSIEKLFKCDSDVALFYFAGHGHVDATGGFLPTSECRRGDEGVSMNDILTYANKSTIRNRIILLDSCHSGMLGAVPVSGPDSILAQGLTVMTASTSDQYALDDNSGGMFTSLLVDAMGGAAANLLGEITPGSVYAHIDKSLSRLEQRPVFKTNVKSFVSLRRVWPIVPRADLLRISEFFPASGSEFLLDPSFEPENDGRKPGMPPANPANVAKLLILRKFYRAALIAPVGVANLWNACMETKTIKLTPYGENYRRLVAWGRI